MPRPRTPTGRARRAPTRLDPGDQLQHPRDDARLPRERRRRDHGAHELIVLDNASPDGSAAAIAAAFPGIRLIASPENLGFARGNNVAAREARGEYILLLNPDTLVLDRAIDRIVAFAGRTPQAGIWGGRTLHGDRTLNPGSVFGRVTLWSLFCRSSGLALIFRQSAFFNPEEIGRLGPRRRARRRRGAGQLLPDPPRPLGAARRLRPRLRDVRRGAGPLPARRAPSAPGRG